MGRKLSQKIESAEAKNLPGLFFKQAEKFRDAPFLSFKEEGRWISRSWSKIADEVLALARGLKERGIESGDRVVIVSENRPEWLIADLAIMTLGAITTPAYTTNTSDDHLYLLRDSGAKTVIVSTETLLEKLLPAARKVPALEMVVVMDHSVTSDFGDFNICRWIDLLSEGPLLERDRLIDGINRTDSACIIYTSGTSGNPKGVLLSHGAILCNCKGAHMFLRDVPGFKQGCETFLSFLPLSHSYEHTCGQFLPISIGAQIFYAEGPDKLVANMAEVQPTIIAAVPRLYEAIRARIRRGIEGVGGLQQKLFETTIALGRKKYESITKLTIKERLQDTALEYLVRRKIRARFGGKLKTFVSGGAALNYDVGVEFLALGLNILQGYGQTESAPVVSCNAYAKNKLRTVGPPLSGVEVKIANDGEILVRGELLMDGYWNRPDETSETIRNGWLYTGDIGVLDEDGYIEITDRKKDIIVNSGGDNISPARVESMLTETMEIEQAFVFGDKQPHLVALIVPSVDYASAWASNNKANHDLELFIKDIEFIKGIEQSVDRVNKKLSIIERVRRFILIPQAFSVENGMMTPTLKLRRHNILSQYGDDLNALYRR